MTLVLSMNPFLEPEREHPLSTYQPVWKTERCNKTCLSNTTSPSHTEDKPKQEPPFRRLPDHVSMSRLSFFKRKFVDDDEASFSFRTYCQTVAPVLEERAHVLRLSLEKMRFIDDPEAFLRRSVLVNNLLRRLRTEILLQSTDWCFPPNPVLSTILPPGSNPTNQALSRAVPTPICLAPQAGPPFRKRFRMVRAGQGDLRSDCAQTCCCFYAAAAAAGHYLPLPFSMYDAELSSPHSSSVFQIASHHKLGLTVIEGHDDEDDEAEEEEELDDEEEEDETVSERRQAGPSSGWVQGKGKSKQKSRTRSLLGHTRTEADSCMTGSIEEEEDGELEEDEEEDHGITHCEWDPASERDLLSVHYWYQRGHRQ
ncbi:SERTA domain-containing protein 4 [Dunckerocampus dactyliophorus]|uniref:SERTA domain-containing protein 4 n=1 Tax=Dunckerocampus dactyliophorus TaxID=161453 RepID=UPI002406C6C3|nr:SERTA domain-containing protein 4 [Dunckerocampus dactyliophorus]